MWIQCTNEATSRLYTEAIVDDAAEDDTDPEPLMDGPVEFTGENNTAQVTQDLGEALVAHYDAIQPYEAGT